jgi:hypothetical protein
VLMRLVYRCRPAGWWGTAIFLVVMAGAYMLTAVRSDQADLYQAAGYNAQQVDVMRQMRSQHPAEMMLAMQLPALVLMIGYLVYVRKYFSARGTEDFTGKTDG